MTFPPRGDLPRSVFRFPRWTGLGDQNVEDTNVVYAAFVDPDPGGDVVPALLVLTSEVFDGFCIEIIWVAWTPLSSS